MAEFNIENSKVEQLNDAGNNIKITGNSGHVAISEQGNAVQTEGAENTVNVDHEKGFWTLMCEKIKGCWAWLAGLFGAG
jgi:hypothetical protein